MRDSFENIKMWFLKQVRSTDLVLLVFLILVVNVSLAFKFAAVLFIYALRPNFKFGLKNGRLPLFYVLILGLAAISYVFNLQRGFNYALLGALSLTYWLMSFLILHQLKLGIEKSGLNKVENTISVFFILNALISFVNLLGIMIEIKDLNPYTFNGLNYKYSASTGDYIHGIMQDLSTANMIINALGLFYFLYRHKYFLSVMCFVIATYTTSNLGNIILFLFFFLIIVLDKSRLNKSMVLCYISFLVVFVIRVSPSNLNYLDLKITKLLKLEHRLVKPHFVDKSTKENLINSYVAKKKTVVIEKKNKVQEIKALIIEKEKKDEEGVIERANNPVIKFDEKQNYLYDFYKQQYGDSATTLNKAYYEKHPGKYTAFTETFSYLKSGTRPLLVGAGPGNFSSKLAYKATNTKISGKYIERYVYLSPEFKDRHLKTSLYFYLQPTTEHSILNFPNSVLNQLAGEYGLIGLALFFIFYVGFYLKRYKKLKSGKILLPLILFFLLTDYWFESFNILIVFELIMFMELTPTTNAHHSE